MHRKGHVGVSMMVAGIVLLAVPVAYALPIILTLLTTERLPDLDFKIPFLKHRGYSHTIWAALVVATAIAGSVAGGLAYTAVSFESVAPFVNPETTFAVLWVGTFLGFMSHYAGDMITNGTGEYGVQLFHPLTQWELPIGLWNANSRLGNNLLFVGGIAVAGLSSAVKIGIIG